ncbi:hypothetical protein NIES4074_65890 (plasmid) [Cylindrospermum sp. NIES-4074]|nr:hypothetical protein NIES4074_65890 [Cylindrospermum sp. NIES-4074]
MSAGGLILDPQSRMEIAIAGAGAVARKRAKIGFKVITSSFLAARRSPHTSVQISMPKIPECAKKRVGGDRQKAGGYRIPDSVATA